MKTFKRVLSLALAMMMCLSVVALPVFATEEDTTDYIVNEDWEADDLKDGQTLVAGDGHIVKGKNNVPTINAIMSEENADGSTNKFLRVPFSGNCVGTAAGQYSGNCDTAVHPVFQKDDEGNAKVVSYTDGGNWVLEMDFRYNKEDTAPRLELQFTSVKCDTVDMTSGETKTTQGTQSWITLGAIAGATDSMINVGTLTGAGEIVAGEWNNIRYIIDLVNGTYETYINGVLYATQGYLAQGNDDKGFRNFVVDTNHLCVYKLNKMTNTYHENTKWGEWDIYFDVDNIKFYNTTDLQTVTVDGNAMKVLPGQELILKSTNKTFVYAEVLKNGASAAELNLSGKVTAEDGMTITTYNATNHYLAYMGYELIAARLADAKAYYTGGLLDATVEVVPVITDPVLMTSENWLKVTLADAAAGKSLNFMNDAISAEKYPVVNHIASYKAEASASIEAVIGTQTLYKLQGTEIAGVTKVEGAPALTAGEAVTIKTVLNLQKKTYDVYVQVTNTVTAEDGSQTTETAWALYGNGGELTFSDIAANSVAVAINKTGAAFTASAAVELAPAYIADGDKATIQMYWDERTQSSKENLHIGSDYDFSRNGQTFEYGVITYPIPEGSPADTVAETETFYNTTLAITDKLNGATIDLTYSLVIYKADFNSATVDANGNLEKGDNINALPKYSSLLTHEGSETDKYVYLPFQGTCTKGGSGSEGSGNFDTGLQLKHSALNKDTAENIVMEFDYYFHYYALSNNKDDANYAGYDYTATDNKLQTPQALFQFKYASYKILDKDGNPVDPEKAPTWIEQFSIDLGDGSVMPTVPGTKAENAQNLTPDAWNTIKLIYDMDKGTFDLSVNGELYYSGCGATKNVAIVEGTLEFKENSLFVGKFLKRCGAFKTVNPVDANNKEDASAEGYSPAPYVGEDISYSAIDNFTLRYLQTVKLTVNGKADTKLENEAIQLAEEGKTYLLSVYTLPNDENLYVTTAPTILPVMGMDITSYNITTSAFATLSMSNIRQGEPTGIRFVTTVDSDELLEVLNLPGFNVEFGTLITAVDLLKKDENDNYLFTMDDLTETKTEGEGDAAVTTVTKNYVTVLSTKMKTYRDAEFQPLIKAAEGDYAYAGSIANIKEENLTRDFVGVGYPLFLAPPCAFHPGQI